MADTFDSRLKLRLQESGGNSGQWGDLLNQTITNVASVFGFGTHQLTADSDATLTLADDGASLDALKSSYLKITSSVSLTATRVLTFSPNTFNQVKYIENATTGSQSITLSQGSGANITIENGATKIVYFDGAGSGAAVVDALAKIDFDNAAEFTTLKVTNIQANDGTASMTLSNSTGNVAFPASIDVTGALTGTTATFTTADNTAQVALVSTDADAADGPILEMFRNSSSPADDDDLGIIKFFGENDASEKIEYGIIEVKAVDVSDGTEDGSINITAILNGTARSRLFSNSTETVFNEGSQDLDFRVEGDSEANLFFVDASTNFIGIGTNSPTQKLDLRGAIRFGTTIADVADGGRPLIYASDGSGAHTGHALVIQARDGAGSEIDFVTGTTPTTRMSVDASGVVKLITANDTAGTSKFLTFGTKSFNRAGIKCTNAATFDGSLEFYTGNASNFAERVRIDSSGNVGIGTSNPTTILELKSTSATAGLSITGGNSNTSDINLGDTDDINIQRIRSDHSDNSLQFTTNNSEAMRIDSSGNLLMGKTSSNFNTAGIEIRGTGELIVTRANDVLHLNRTSTDGNIATFRKDNTTVGIIGSRSGVVSFIVLDPRTSVKGAALVGGSVDANTGIINPGKADGDIADDAISFGTASSRFKDLHLSGTANTGLLEVASANTTLANFQANVGGAGGVGVVNIKTNTSASNGLQLVGNGSGAAIAGGALAATVMNTENGPLRFGTNATEKVRIDSAGAFLIGTSASIGTSPAKLEVLGGSGGGRCINTKTAITTSANAITFNNGNGQVGSIATSGSATAYNTSSDYRLKENITDLTSATDRLKQLAPKRFNFKVDPDTTVDGFIAHEVSSIVPEAITGEKDEVDDEGNPVYQGIDQSKLVPLLVATIQELEARIAALESE